MSDDVTIPRAEYDALVRLAHEATVMKDSTELDDYEQPPFSAAVEAWLEVERQKVAPAPTVAEALVLARHIYQRHSAGCCLHIVLDDGNLEDDDVRFCIKQAARADAECQKSQDGWCGKLGEMLLPMSMAQRRELRERTYVPLHLR
jgi:hypothetical protein